MFPRKSPQKKPVKIDLNTKKMNDMNAFIDNELKILQSMNRRQHPNSLINPININNNMVDSKNNLKTAMAKTSFTSQNTQPKPPEDQMRMSQSKFEGFSKVTKFTDNPNTSQIIDKKDSRRTRRPPSSSSTKSEPFVIKFPQEQGNKNKNDEILKRLNKDKEIEINFNNKNVMGNITGLKPENKINEDKNTKKNYIESYNKIEDKPKNIFGDEEIEEDYGDFENVEENKVENKNDWEDMFGENANFNDIDEEKKLQPTKINKDKSKREQIIERMNDIKSIILLSDEYMDIASFEKKEGFDNNFNFGTNNFNNEKAQEVGINTDLIEYKDKGTITAGLDLNFDENENNDNNDEGDINDKDKELHLGSSYKDAEKEKKSKIMVASYQPMSYDAYNVFVKIAPSIETMLLNNINKYILQKKDDKQIEESTGIHKLSMEFNFPQDLLSYMFPNNSNNIKINIDKFLFFDTKPYLIAYSLSLSSNISSSISQIFQDNFGEINSANLIMIYDIYTKKIIKTLFSQSKVNDMVTLGEGENLLVTARVGGEFDIFDITQTGDDNNNDFGNKYFMGFEHDYNKNNISLGREEINSKNTIKNNNPKFKLLLPIFSSYNFLQSNNNENSDNNKNENISFNSQVKKMIKVINKNSENKNYLDKLYELFILDQTGYLISFQFNDTDIHSLTRLEHIFNEPFITSDLNPLIKRCFNTMPDNGDYVKENLLTEIYDIKYYKENILFILCNFGLCKLIIEGKDNFLCNPIYSSNSEENPNNMTCFDISETGEIVCCFNDRSVKVINEQNKELLFSSLIDGIDNSTLVNNITWSKVICKNENNKLIRKHLLANFFILTSKNEFIIYDLNQKKMENLRKVKKLKDFGKAMKLSRKNSIMEMSDCSFIDYSNLIVMSECDQLNKAKFTITKLCLRKQYYEEWNIDKVNVKIINKLKTLLNN